MALQVARDQNQETAVRIALRLARERATLVTTNFVVAETHAMMLRYLGSTVARLYLRDMYESQGVAVFRVEEEDEKAARAIIERYTDKDFSLVDALSFVVMQRLAIKQAFTFDAHFVQFGWQVLAA